MRLRVPSFCSWVGALGFALAGCSGPPASDLDLCLDVATRLCAGPICDTVTSTFSVDATNCVSQLVAQSGCSGAFTFSVPSRNRFLECRIPLVRDSDLRTAVPGCPNVNEFLNSCPDVVAFYRGVR